MNKEKTGTLIKNARIEKGLTQLELSDILGVSNKAVSRWECGETFPDVALLDHLATTLGLTIEELVTGEKIALPDSSPETPHANTYRELVHTVRLQRKERIRQYRGLLLGVLLGAVIFAEGLLSFLGQQPAHPWLLYSISLALTLLSMNGLVSQTEDHIPSRKEKLAAYISVGSFVYAFVLLLTITLLLKNNILTEAFPIKTTGPVLSGQFLVLWLYNFILGCYFFRKQIQSASSFRPAMISCVSALFLLLFYQSILGTLTSVDMALYPLLLSTGLVLAIVVLTSVVLFLYHKFLSKSEPTP